MTALPHISVVHMQCLIYHDHLGKANSLKKGSEIALNANGLKSNSSPYFSGLLKMELRINGDET